MSSQGENKASASVIGGGLNLPVQRAIRSCAIRENPAGQSLRRLRLVALCPGIRLARHALLYMARSGLHTKRQRLSHEPSLPSRGHKHRYEVSTVGYARALSACPTVRPCRGRCSCK